MAVCFKWLLGSGARCFVATSRTLSGRSLCLSLFFLGWTSTAQAIISASERAVLTNLYASTNGASWSVNTNWNGGVGTECSWAGVTCDAAQSHVIGISLNMNHLVGTLPSLSGLTALQYFWVDGNQLTGSIPSLTGLTALLSFSAYLNQLTGSIPSLSGLTALQGFIVSNNQLTGSIPSLSGLTALRRFEVSRNQLTGSIPSLSGLATLHMLGVASNQLTGPVPVPPPSLLLGMSHLCGNSLVSSGNPTVDIAWVAAQNSSGVPWGNWLACQRGIGPPTCTLTATPASISAGWFSTLTASCIPQATSYVWSANTGFDSAVTIGNVSPRVTTTYTVTGSNAGSTGNAASATVTVTSSIP